MTSLDTSYDVLLLDLDGTVYQGPEEIPGAKEALARCTARQFFVTNNASRGPEAVAKHLTQLGMAATADAVVTSAQAAARLVAARIPSGSMVLVVGAEALAAEIANVGLVPVRSFEDRPVAVVQGFSPDIGWRDLAEGALAIRAGALWVASNVDTTLPSERGLLPGNGSLVAALRTATGQEPLVAGKPASPIMDDACRLSRASNPLVVGDRLDTDIAGANGAELDSLLVLTGVSSVVDVVLADSALRPTYIANNLDGLHLPLDDVRFGGSEHWHAEVLDGDLVVRFTGADGDPLTGIRAVAPVAWSAGNVQRIRAADEATAPFVAAWHG
ncbi:HAD-IIA family hydrolase [Tomitella biformata]|uniref:HAD-IIA family hydrolase n=1 Tax=Tomitella biformata TaxID=630403 RepID=UPI0004671918|nr:HAD-IIA family hydrolase [Tomitella biformata]